MWNAAFGVIHPELYNFILNDNFVLTHTQYLNPLHLKCVLAPNAIKELSKVLKEGTGATDTADLAGLIPLTNLRNYKGQPTN